MAKNPTGHQVIVSRFFRGLPVEDATEKLYLKPTPKDIRSGKRMNPGKCALVQASRTQYGCHNALVMRRTAYFDLPSRNGRGRVAKRFMISPETHSAIVEFDKHGTMPVKGFVFLPPSPGQASDIRRKYSRDYVSQVQSGARPAPKKTKPHKRYIKTMDDVRDGRGSVGISFGIED